MSDGKLQSKQFHTYQWSYARLLFKWVRKFMCPKISIEHKQLHRIIINDDLPTGEIRKKKHNNRFTHLWHVLQLEVLIYIYYVLCPDIIIVKQVSSRSIHSFLLIGHIHYIRIKRKSQTNWTNIHSMDKIMAHGSNFIELTSSIDECYVEMIWYWWLRGTKNSDWVVFFFLSTVNLLPIQHFKK